jgi:hypothetical protein
VVVVVFLSLRAAGFGGFVFVPASPKGWSM